MKRANLNFVVCIAVACLAALLAPGCGDDAPECLTSNECPPNSLCSVGRCADQGLVIGEPRRPEGAGPIIVAPRDGGAAAVRDDSDAGAPVFACREIRDGDLSIEEVLAAVPTGPEGDANGDGIRDAYDDEFVEIANRSADPVGLRGVELWVNDRVKYRFDVTDCLDTRGVIVVFSGGPGAVERRVAGKRFGLGNGGGTVSLRRSDGTVLDLLEYGETDGSWVRAPALVGAHQPHRDVSSLAFSPGRCPDGSEWDARCLADSDSFADAGFEGADAGRP
jgi:hypothetical protein